MGKLTSEDIKAIGISFKELEDKFKEINEVNENIEKSMHRLSVAMERLKIKPEEDSDDVEYNVVSSTMFVQYSSHLHMLQVDKRQAKILNNCGVDIYQCSVGNTMGGFYTAYLADLKFSNTAFIYYILEKVNKYKTSLFQEIDTDYLPF